MWFFYQKWVEHRKVLLDVTDNFSICDFTFSIVSHVKKFSMFEKINMLNKLIIYWDEKQGQVVSQPLNLIFFFQLPYVFRKVHPFATSEFVSVGMCLKGVTFHLFVEKIECYVWLLHNYPFIGMHIIFHYSLCRCLSS